MTVLADVLAIGWEPELRGILIVIIAVVMLCGSIYLVLATNLGARLGFLVALAGLAGWMILMGIIWLIYGIGLQGPDPSWAGGAGTHRAPGHRRAVPGRRVRRTVSRCPTDDLRRGGRHRRRPVRRGGLGRC